MTPAEREAAAGQRIARARRRRGLSQAVLAGLVGRSESWLSQVERGKRSIDSHSVLVRLAEVLWVDIEELTGSADLNETGQRAHPAAPLIEQAMMGYGAPGQKLQQIARRGRHESVRVRRALIIMASASGTTVPAIARLVAAHEDTVRDVIHAFNERGWRRWTLSGREAVPA